MPPSRPRRARRRLALLFAVLVSGGALAGCIRDFEEPHHVRVASLDLAPASVLASDVVINLTTVLDNRGGGSSKTLKLVAKAYDEATGFLLAENEALVGALPGDTTRPVSQFLKVPRSGNVRLDSVLFEEELGIARASISARHLERLEPEVVDTGLRVSDTDFIVRAIEGNGSRARVEAALYLTNEGSAPSEDLRIQVKAREVATRLVADTADLATGVVRPGSTVVRSVNLTVPDGHNYVFEMLVWRGDVIVHRASGEVSLAPTQIRPKDQEVVVTNPNLQEFIAPSHGSNLVDRDASGDAAGGHYFGVPSEPSHEPMAVPGPGFALVLLALLGLAAVPWSRRRARTEDTRGWRR